MCWFAALCVPALLAAQSAVDTTLTLADVVRVALTSGFELRQLQRQQIASEAGRDVAAAPFTPVVRMFAARVDERSKLDGTAAQAPTSLLSTSTRYSVTVDKMLRSGVILQPSINVTRADLSTATLPPPNRASVNLAATVPLRRGLGASASRNGEIAATREADASRSDVRQAAARAVFTSVSAFWDYVAASRRLDIQRQAERRANELTIETRTLVQADERSASELHSLDANAALKRITRIAAEQAVLEARQRLGLVLGVNADDLARLGAPATAFPSSEAYNAPDTPHELAMASAAPSRRDDLAAARARQAGAQAREDGSAADARSRLDLILDAGYSGIDRGGAFRQYYSSLFQGVAGLNTTVQLSYTPAASIGGARALRVQADAAVQRSALQVADLSRTAISATRVAAEGLRSARAQLEAADSAVSLSERSIASEIARFRHGMSTRFDVIQAEDALTGALLGRIAAQALAAQALVRLRFESGRLLIAGESQMPRVDVATLLRSTTDEW